MKHSLISGSLWAQYAPEVAEAAPAKEGDTIVTFIFAPGNDLPWIDTDALPAGYDLTIANETQLRKFYKRGYYISKMIDEGFHPL